jgi:hypothetical protein
MSTTTDIRPDESGAETFCELMYRFMSVAHRLRLAVNDIEHSESLAHGLHTEHKPAFFVLQEATDDLEKLREDFRAWEDTHEHKLREIERRHTPKEVQE